MSKRKSVQATGADIKGAERCILELIAEIEAIRSGKRGIRGKRAQLNAQLCIAYRIGRRSKSREDWKKAFANICRRQKISTTRKAGGPFTRLTKLLFANENPTSRIRYAKVFTFAYKSDWKDKKFKSSLEARGVTELEQAEIDRRGRR